MLIFTKLLIKNNFNKTNFNKKLFIILFHGCLYDFEYGYLVIYMLYENAIVHYNIRAIRQQRLKILKP